MEFIGKKILLFMHGDSFNEEVLAKQNFGKLRILGIHKGASDTPFNYRLRFYVLEVFFLLQIGTIVWDMTTVLADIGLFGDNLCVLVGLLLVQVKRWHNLANIDELDACLEQLQQYHEHYLQRGETFVRRMRHQHLQERLFLLLGKMLSLVLGSCLIFNPLFTRRETLIFRAGYPFSTDTTLGYGCVFLCQSFLICYVLYSILYIDVFGSELLSQISLLFCLHRMEFEQIGADRTLPDEGPLPRDDELRKKLYSLIASHQDLLVFCTRVKRMYESNIMVQFVSSMLIICLTAFELMFVNGDPAQMIRFGAYMVTAFYQMFVWSFFGDRVTYMSTSINDATIRCNWIVLDNGLKKDLAMVTMRSQKPFIIDVYLLFPLTYGTFIAILRRSYSIFTLLCTMIE